jgi:hypothetical protein
LVAVIALLAASQPAAGLQASPTACLSVSGGEVCMEYIQDEQTPTMTSTETPVVTDTITVTPTGTSTPPTTAVPITFLEFLDIKLDSMNVSIGPITNSEWYFPGYAATGSCKILHLGYMTVTPTVVYALWRVVWNPQAPAGVSPSGVRLITSDPGFPEKTEIARILQGNTVTPINSGVVVTEQMQALFGMRTEKNLCIQTLGTGSAGPHIFSVVIELVLRYP